MMKKLLVLMLVFGLASVANADLTGVELSVEGVTNGPNTPQVIELPICEFLDIDVHGPAGYNWEGYIFIAGTWPGAGGEWGDDIGPFDPLGSGYYFDGTAQGYPGFPEIKDGAGENPTVDRFEFGGYGFGYTFEAETTDPEDPPVEGGAEFDFLYHCCGPWCTYVTINLYDAADLATVQDSIVIHQIPEPATIALLGLGGLFLRRRKK